MKFRVWVPLALLLIAASARADFRIVAATTDLGAIARAVAGEDAKIDVVARPTRDPHTLEVRPSTMRMAAKADVYLSVGLSLDIWSDAIVRGSRNRDLRIVDCSEAVEAIEVPERVDASMGDVHPEGNPHYWLDPDNGVRVAHLLAERFAIIDPEHEDIYRENVRTFASEIERRIPTWDARLRGKKFFEYHRNWSYLAARFGVEIVAQIEPLPGIPPAARQLVELGRVAEREGVRVAIREPYHSASPIEFLEREAEMVGIVFASSCRDPEPASYIALFDEFCDLFESGSK